MRRMETRYRGWTWAAAGAALAGWTALMASPGASAAPPSPPAAPVQALPEASAASTPSVSGAGGDHFASEGAIGKVQKRIETLRAWRIADELGFDEKTNARLFALLRGTDEQRIRIEADNRGILRVLRRQLEGPDPDPRAVGAALDRLAENRLRQKALEEEHLRRIREVLDPVQSARYLFFELDFQRELQERVTVTLRERRGRITDAPRGAHPAHRNRPEGP